VKVVTWNLGYAFGVSKRKHLEAWNYVRDEIRADIGLLQEVDPPELASDENLVFQPCYRTWGTAVYARGLALHKLTLRRYPRGVARGRVTAATAIIGSRELGLASIHAPVINREVHPHLDHVFHQLEALFKDHSCIVAGDLNSSRACEQRWPGSGHGPFFKRIETGPFVDCHWKFHAKEIQTFFRKDTRWCLQDDHIFASPDVAKRFTSCDVLDNKTTRQLSDHLPIVAEVDRENI
jgi:endonuclease/exonuclease/phosphatase family metal-dependent hydrolase